MGARRPCRIVWHPICRKNRNSPFESNSLQLLDEVLSHMNDTWDWNGQTTIERVYHAFHMDDLLTRARKEYRKLEANPVGKEACKCARDVKKNGLYKAMFIVSSFVRESQFFSGHDK